MKQIEKACVEAVAGSLKKRNPNAFALETQGGLITAQGRSMELRIHDGDYGTRVKQLEHIPDLGVILHSDNREEFPPKYALGTANDITILGEVVWSGHKWEKTSENCLKGRVDIHF